MKNSDVPQDNIPAFQGHLRKGLYALDENDEYILKPSSGWSAEQVVLDLAVQQFADQAHEALERVRIGEASPLEYHMYCQRMDYQQLASCVGKWKWQVKRHCSAAVFDRLGTATRQKYAQALGLTLEQLSQVPTSNEC